MRKGQTAVEYLIILSVVIIIALIVVGVMGGFGPAPVDTSVCTEAMKNASTCGVNIGNVSVGG